jgi:hypothetical protein
MKEVGVGVSWKQISGVCCAALALVAPATGAGRTADDDAMALLREFVRPGADPAALSKTLRPTRSDYDAVFAPAVARKLEAAYEPAWEQGLMLVQPKREQKEVLAWGASSEEIRSWTGAAAQHFPGGWKEVGPHLKPGVRLYAFKFVEPGQGLGMAFDGLVRINGQWRIFPKPWRALR